MAPNLSLWFVISATAIHLCSETFCNGLQPTVPMPWPTPCEVAVEMQTLVQCEHLAAESRGWSAYDWAEHCLKQARGIPEAEVCEQNTLRQWQFVSGQNLTLDMT